MEHHLQLTDLVKISGGYASQYFNKHEVLTIVDITNNKCAVSNRHHVKWVDKDCLIPARPKVDILIIAIKERIGEMKEQHKSFMNLLSQCEECLKPAYSSLAANLLTTIAEFNFLLEIYEGKVAKIGMSLLEY
jgi:hypothetical protein